MAKVLIADDDPVLRRAYRILCEKHGWEVVTATNGQEALEIAENYHPDLIIADVLMPVMTGIDFLAAYKRNLKNKAVPFIVLTNSVVPANSEARARSLGANEYALKSKYSPQQLAQLIYRYLDESDVDI